MHKSSLFTAPANDSRGVAGREVSFVKMKKKKINVKEKEGRMKEK